MTDHQKSRPRQENDIIPSEIREKAGGQVLSDSSKQLLFMERSIQAAFKFPEVKATGNWEK